MGLCFFKLGLEDRSEPLGGHRGIGTCLARRVKLGAEMRVNEPGSRNKYRCESRDVMRFCWPEVSHQIKRRIRSVGM